MNVCILIILKYEVFGEGKCIESFIVRECAKAYRFGKENIGRDKLARNLWD